MKNTATPIILNPRQIASWFQPEVRALEPSLPVIASVPKLQRGLVWNPSQIEMLWDSILRGFPIGSLVVCPRIPGQNDGDDASVTHHLLDGQQRAHAISLGYDDPFTLSHNSNEESPHSILWIDLLPDIPSVSTRDFLVRLTTPSHPWGFRRSDGCETLHTWQIREILERKGLDPASPDYERPAPRDLYPAEANIPVPMAWLLLSDGDHPDTFWSRLAKKCEAMDTPWAENACAFLSDVSEGAMAARGTLMDSLRRLANSQIVALPAPDSLVHDSRAERAGSTATEDNSAIEHLFQRLNRQGTRLDGEELAYSMIKAYWPQVAKPIEQIIVRRMPASRLVMMATRAALTPARSIRFRAPLSVSDIRRLAIKRDNDAAQVLEFIDNRLKACCQWIEDVLRYDPEKNPQGLLPVHLAHIARSQPDVYLLLLRIADQHLGTSTGAEPIEDLRPVLLALVMRLSWFAVDTRQAVNYILCCHDDCVDGFTTTSLRMALQTAQEAEFLQKLPSPEELVLFLDFNESDLESWTWQTAIQGDGESYGVELRQKCWRAFLQSLGNRDLLLYAQRHFIARRFSDFDPSRRDLWEGHNRPWDFDHLHARALVNNFKSGNQYQRFLKQWLDTIGNLRAWPFEDNRSDSAELSDKKITTAAQLEDSFLYDFELPAFSMGRKAIRYESSSRAFAQACLRRMSRMYRECWNQMI
jgi:hypothetical protein